MIVTFSNSNFCYCDKLHVAQICEDVPKQLDEEVSGLPDLPSKVLVPRLLHLFSSLHIEAKCLAIGVTNLLAGANPESLAPSLDRSAALQCSSLRISSALSFIAVLCCSVVSSAPQCAAAHLFQSFAWPEFK